MKLRSRFILSSGVTLLVTLVASFWLFGAFKADLMSGLGALFAKRQVLYNASRTLQPLVRELALAQKLADSSTIRNWANNEETPSLRVAALRELEEYRRFFANRSYFFVINRSGHYYYNNQEGEFAGEELRYTISPQDPEDHWYFAAIESGEPYQLNVDHDEKLGVTNVWINVVVTDGERPLGVVGTGLDLSAFLSQVVDAHEEGITNIFVESSGAIQAHKEVGLIDFRTASKSLAERKTIFQLLDTEEERAGVRVAMDRIAGENEGTVETTFVHIGGEHYLMGITYLPQIEWYNITLMSIDTLLGAERFAPFGILLVVALSALTLFIVTTLHRIVVQPVARLDEAVRQFSQGHLPPQASEPAYDEVGRLEKNFRHMASTVHAFTENLEELVAQRTSELARKNRELEEAMGEIQNLQGLLPICMHCKKIRDEEGQWTQLEYYIAQRSNAEFSHGYCPDCAEKAMRDNGLI